MMWAPVQSLSDIRRHEELNIPVFWWPQDYIPGVNDPVSLQVGKRYSIKLEHMQIEAEVCRINYGAESPLQLMWLGRCGSTLLGWFSPDDFLEVSEV